MAATVVENGPWHGHTVAEGRYRDLATLGEGGMGFVYRAYDAHLQKHAVIKAPRRSLVGDREQIERFEQEIRALVNLSFPQIVPIIDVGRHEGIPFAVMRYLSGGSLAERIRADVSGAPSPMAPASLKSWLANISLALDFVHRQGYVHRDVKPSNILFDEHGQAYLSDFGIAQIVGDRSDGDAQRGTLMGTLDYLAPELIACRACDGRADQYALAVTVFEALAGRLPFGELSVQEIAEAQVSSPPPLLSKVEPRVPPAISVAVNRALSKSPERRYACCADFARNVLRAAMSVSPKEEPGAAAMASENAIHDTIRMSLAPTESQPRAKARTEDRDRATQILPVQIGQPVAAIDSAPQKKFRSKRIWFVSACLVAVVVLAGTSLLLLSGHSEPNAPATDVLPSAAELARRIEDWNGRIHSAEQSVTVDSTPLLNRAEYSSAEELSSLIAAQVRGKIADVKRTLDGLERDLSELRQLTQSRADELNRSSKRSSIDSGSQKDRAVVLAEEHSLSERQSSLAKCEVRLQELQRSLSSPTLGVDKAASAEIGALREMEASQTAKRRVDLRGDTYQRAGELAHSSNRKLASLALNCLARSPDPQRNRLAIAALDNASDNEQHDLCWSLLVSGERDAVESASRYLAAHDDAAAAMRVPDVLDLVEDSPDSYRPLLGIVARWPQSADVRERLLRLQAPRMTDEWAAEIERSCDSGLLHDRVPIALADILNGNCRPSFDLAARLLDSHPDLSLESLPAGKLDAWYSANSRFGNQLVRRFLSRGNSVQRDAALVVCRRAESPVDQNALFHDLRTMDRSRAATLLNQLLPARDETSLRLEEVLLERPSDLSPAEIAYESASTAALGRTAIREPLLNLAQRSTGTGAGWALRQRLGPSSNDALARLEADRKRQLSLLKTVVSILDSPRVMIAGGDPTGDRGIAIPTDKLDGLPSDFTPEDWNADGDCARTIASLKSRVGKLMPEANDVTRLELEQVERYLDALQRLTQLSGNLAQVYDAVVQKQLPGAKRKLKIEAAKSWTFRFYRSSLDDYLRSRRDYESLAKASESTKMSLPPILK